MNDYLSEFKSTIWEPDPGITQELESVIRDKDVDMQVGTFVLKTAMGLA